MTPLYVEADPMVVAAGRLVGPLDKRWSVYVKAPLFEDGEHQCAVGLSADANSRLAAARLLVEKGIAVIGQRWVASGTEYVIKAAGRTHRTENG